jgi:glycosyltransferase involved in cell wall biosynthesis
LKKICFTVTNDLSYDQRMIRICTSLSRAGYEVLLVGRKRRGSIPLTNQGFRQVRLNCWFEKGKLFYAEYNLRLLFYLLFLRTDAVCAIDLDSILPCLWVSKLRGLKRAYDAHELFTEMKELISRPGVQKVWKRIERYAVPQFIHGYTVSESITEEFAKRYGRSFTTIRNLPVKEVWETQEKDRKMLLYQGAVNEARGLEFLIPAMQDINMHLVICGDGNLMDACKAQVRELHLEDKISFTGMLPPAALKLMTAKAYIGINLVEPVGLNQRYSLANKFFDYIQAEVPQVTMNFPEYRRINDHYEVALLLNDLAPRTISEAVNNLLNDNVIYLKLIENCSKAKDVYIWQHEEEKLVKLYHQLFSS